MGRRHKVFYLLAIFGLVAAAGCKASPWAADGSEFAATSASAAPAVGPAEGTLPSGQAAAGRPGDSSNGMPPPGMQNVQAGPVGPGPDPRAVQALVAEVAQAERLDQAGCERLAADLQRTDPAMWPALVQTFRASLAYRRASSPHEASQLVNPASQAAVGPSMTPPPAPPVEVASLQEPARDARPEGPAEAPWRLTAQRREAERRNVKESPASERDPAEPNQEEHIATDGSDPAEDPRGGSPAARRLRNKLASSTSSRSKSAVKSSETKSSTTKDAKFAKKSDVPASEKDEPGTLSADARKASGRTAAASDDVRAKMDDENVVQTSHSVPIGKNEKSDNAVKKGWREHLNAAIGEMEAEAKQMPKSQAEVDMQTRLRMLYLLADRREDALKPVASAPPASQEFLTQGLYGMATWLDSERMTDAGRRAGETKLQWSNAIQRLGEAAPLTLRNLSFVHKVGSYGSYEPFDTYEFLPDQEVILYVEVENFKSEETSKGFTTVLQGSYQIFDSEQRQVSSRDLNVTEDVCRNLRRDFFVIYGFHIPKSKDMKPGKYTLKLTVEDKKCGKFGQATISFSIRDTEKR